MHLSIFLLFVFALGHEGLHVHGSSGPVVAQLGGSVLLSCFSESPLPLEGLQVEWRKMDSDSVVSFSWQGESRPDLQSQEFRGRVDLFPDELLKGNFSILIRNVVKDDVGVYRCQINTTQLIISSEVIIEIQDIEHLVVTGAGHAVFARECEDVILNCSVDSHAHEIEEVTWKKTDSDQDILVLLYQDSEIFTDSSHERYQGRVNFFYSEMPKGNFSLKLTDVQMEDQGEFVCEVHTGNMSARTVVVLQGVGFSALHISILVLCSIALMLTLGFCIPVFMQLKRPGARDEGLMKMHIVFILCPNICMFVAFCLWLKEGFLTEAVSCLSVSIIRPVMLMKTCPDLKRFPNPLQKATRNLAGPLYNSIITISACSFFYVNITRIQTAARYVVIVLTLIGGLSFISGALLAIYDIWIRVLICLDVFNVRLLGVLVSSTKDNFDYILEIPSVVPPLVMGVMMVITLKKYFFQGKVFDCVHITLSSVIVTIFSLSEICVYVIISIATKDFSSGWKLLFEAAVFVFVWSGVIYLLKHKNKYRCQWGKIASICCILIAAILIFTYVIYMSYSYKNIFKEQKDAAGYVTLVVFVHILAVTALFKHPENIPKFLHIMVYMFGAVVLSTVNAIALATELILKADKGARTIGDLRVVVFSLETLFVSAWLTLQMYDTWRKFKDRRNPNSLAEEEQEMRALRR